MAEFRRHLPLYMGALVLAAAAALSLWHLGTAPFWDYDESTYAQIAHEALAGGPVFAPTFMERPFFEKPPLYMWEAESSAKLFGESKWSLRLPSALMGVMAVLLVMLFAWELSQHAWAAVLAGAILATTAPFIETARQVRLDVPVAFWVTLAAYGFVRGLRQERWFLLFGVSVALAALTKSVVAVFALAAVPIFATWFWDFSWLRKSYFWLSLVASAVVVLPWHIYETVLAGSVFWRDYVGINVTTRFHEELFNMQEVSNHDYIWYLSNFAVPWMQVFVLGGVAVAAYWRDIPARYRAGIGASVTLIACIIAVFFAAATKAPTYLIPVYPFAAIAISLAILGLMKKMPRSYTALLAVAIGICILVGLSTTVYDAFHENPYYSQTDELSQEEKLVADQLLQHPQSVWYVYGGDRDVGSIMYYTQNIRPVALTGAEHPKVGDIILMYGAQHDQFFKNYGNFSTTVLYPGAQLLLLQVVSED